MSIETMDESRLHEKIRELCKGMIDAREIRNDERRENDRRFDQSEFSRLAQAHDRLLARIDKLEKTIADLMLALVRR